MSWNPQEPFGTLTALMYVQLEKENGARIRRLEDPSLGMAFERFKAHAQGTTCWQFIDDYGDTTFNRLQLPPFLKDLAHLRSHARGDDLRVIAELEELALECQKQIHTYLKFYGD